VPQLALDVLDALALGDEERGIRMAERVDHDMPELRAAKGGLPRTKKARGGP
jgi:hypothetical protein